MVRAVRPQGFEHTVCLPGATLGTILKSASDIPGFKFIQPGIPNVCLKGSAHIDIRKKCVFRDLITEFPEMGINGILLPFYPPAYLKSKYYPTIDYLNERIIRAYRGLGESTPRLNELVFHPQKEPPPTGMRQTSFQCAP